ncbi:hypothetical protein LG204_05045 [Methylovorus menthalis]|uniref:hypothetical protein n=1 Tax=Methylovorus menthalis TaxID=1002227 RepID=UPI001E51C4AC|nr:hypothetical protein [Methylovorus menthalis]MCB4810677.1 hypothetical protein [Methylovorus menthalis]
MKYKTSIFAIGIFILCIWFLLPLALYVYSFGIQISNDHERWAEFGSAMGGIYSPLLAVCTLVVLGAQVTLQRRQTALQQQINTHEYDQAFLLQSRSDIEFYGSKMNEVMSVQVLPGIPIKLFLKSNFTNLTKEDLDSPSKRELAANLHASTPMAYDLWAAVYPILAGMAHPVDKPMYELGFVASSQKLIALLGFEMCVALDNLHRVQSENRTCVDYLFSPLLRAAE